MATKEKKKAPEKKPAAIVFPKFKLLTLDCFANRRDLLSVLLEDGKEYTKDQVNDLIEAFMNPKKKGVK